MSEIIDLGRWFFAVECAGCGNHISLGKAPTPDEESTPKSFELQVTCPCCGLNGTYSPAQVSTRYGNGEQGLTLLD
jgi:ribosomal protein S27E